MGKKLFISTLLTLIISVIISTAHTATYTTTHKKSGPAQSHVKYTPDNTIIVFDIDKVIIGGTPPLGNLFWRYKYDLIPALCNIHIISNILRLWWRREPAEAYMDLFATSPYPNLVNLACDAITSRPVIQGTVAIIKELKEAGYELHIATNETKPIFDLNKKEHPDIFGMFDSAQLAAYTPGAIVKPNPDYFKHLLEQLAPTKKPFIFFTDDKKANIESAKSLGIIGIHFTSPDQLHQALEKYGVLPAQKESFQSNPSNFHKSLPPSNHP